jgi:hypothetical protein
LQIGVCPFAVSLQQYNTQVTHTIYVSHRITQLYTNKQNREKHISSQSYTNSEGHLTASEYSVDKGEEIKLSQIQALEAY